MLALLSTISRLTGCQKLQQAPLLPQFLLDLRQCLQGLKDTSQVGTRATPALCLSFADREVVSRMRGPSNGPVRHPTIHDDNIGY
jgi:hypothetical protein